MPCLAVLTSGGDAPGMNAAVRAVVRRAVDHGWDALGVRYGFLGLLERDFTPLGARDVGGVIHKGGTFLGSSRCPEFEREPAQLAAIEGLRDRGVDGLIVIGGNGSQAGAHSLHVLGFPVVGIASTIDNDLLGTDITLGTDTALNVALESIDRLRTTAVSHRRVVLVEVMGRDTGYLAAMTAIAGGAEAVVIPEDELDLDELVADVTAAFHKKSHALVVVAEGAALNATALAEHLGRREDFDFRLRVTVLGHVQRGGVPTAFDRLLGSRLGAGAADAVAAGRFGMLIGLRGAEVAATPLADVVGGTRRPEPELRRLADTLAQ